MLWACGCAPTPNTQPAVTAPPSANAPTAATTPEDLHRLPPEATYGDLVDRIAQLDGRAQEQGREPCILARYTRTGDFELRVELAVAVRPPPQPPADLDAPLATGEGLSLISRFGSLGDGPRAVVELTATGPTRAWAALVLTDQGAYLVDSDPQAAESRQGPRPVAELRSALAALGERSEPVRVELLAESTVPLAQVDDALVTLDELRLAVALATLLPEGTQLPPGLGARQPATCPDGLPEAEGEEGSLELAAIQPRLAPFAESARICAHQAGGRALAGGRLTMALRVLADGTVGPVCSLEDDIGEAALVQCLTHAAARLRFPPPGGSVDLHLPLRLAPAAIPVPAAACR